MDTQKGFVSRFGEWWDERQAYRRRSATRDGSSGRLTGWLPTRGNVIFTFLMIALLVAAQTAGALPLARPQPAPTAASTGTIAYQGRLANASGAPISDTVNMKFRLYTTATGGTWLWEEPWDGPNAVRVSDGLFNVMLGSLSALPISQFTNAQALFLGITVGTDDEMTPRVQLGSVPFAVQALTVPDGSVTTRKIADGAVTQAKLGADVSLAPPDGSITTAKLADGAVTQAKAPFAVRHFVGLNQEEAFPTVQTGTYVIILKGGGAAEAFDIDISQIGFDVTPVGIVQITDSGSPDMNTTLARYTWDGSTATRARIIFFRTNGQPVQGGAIRFNLILWSD